MPRQYTVAALLASMIAASPAYALTIDFATGQDSSGNIQTTGDLLDAHWTASNADNYKHFPNTYVVAPGNADWFGGWFADGPNSSWIAPDPDTNVNGNFTLTYSFNLTGYDLATAIASAFQWSIDDQGTVQLNGNTLDTQSDGQWGSFHSFTFDTSDLVAGVNTLTMNDISDHNLEAGRLEGTLTISPSTAPVPEPSSLALLGAAMFGFAIRRRARRSAT